MTMPLERSLAVLWAGGLLITLNGDRRVPIELRRAATSIARHFPTVEDVGHAANLSLLRDFGGMFEHPRDCPNWQENSPGRPLTHHTRLNWPSEDIDDRIDGYEFESVDVEDGATMEDLADQVELVNRAQDAVKRRETRLYAMCIDHLPALYVCFVALKWNSDQAIEWVSRRQFDDNTKHVGHLLLEDRNADICDRLRQLTHEHPVEWRPLG